MCRKVVGTFYRTHIRYLSVKLGGVIWEAPEANGPCGLIRTFVTFGSQPFDPAVGE